MRMLQIGRPFREDVPAWPEAYQYNYDVSGHELLLFAAHLTPREIEGVSAGQADFALSVRDDIIFFQFRFAGAFDWSDCPFNWHLVAPENRQAPDLTFPPDVGATLRLVLIEATNGLVRALRVCSLSHRFSKQLHRAILKQRALPFNRADYERRLAEIYRRTSSTQLVQQAIATCTAGQVAPDERPPFSYRN